MKMKMKGGYMKMKDIVLILNSFISIKIIEIKTHIHHKKKYSQLIIVDSHLELEKITMKKLLIYNCGYYD